MLKRENIKYIIIFFIVIVTIIVIFLFDLISGKNRGVAINNALMLEGLKKNEIGVYIDGAVKKPGYIKIPKGSTLEYALNKVEGITKDADIQNIDLKRILKNQEKIIVPIIKYSEIEEDSSINISDDKININTASIEELTSLEGVGEKTAEKIVEYREINKFDSIEEIMEIKGIRRRKV